MPQLEADVAVIGGGTSGLAAALAAAEKGARVVVFEKASTTGGTGNMGMGIFAVDSRVHRENNVQLTTDEAFNIFMNKTHWRGDARLIRAFIDKSASTIDWLEKMGVQFVYMEPRLKGAKGTGLLIVGEYGHTGPGASATMTKRLTQRAQKLGGTFLLRTQAKKILKEGDRIAGVLAEDQSGETVQAKAKAVIIATGGFGDDPEWIKKYTGYEQGHNLHPIRIPGLVGDGIRIAWEAGAGASEMSMQLIFGMPPPYNGVGGTMLELVAFRQPNLMVNVLGERFINEEIMANTAFTGNAIARQKDRCAFTIFDGATKQHYEENGMHFTQSVEVESIDDNVKQVLDQGCPYVFVADSLEELTGKTGINADGLRKTLDEYNAACEAGRDELFNKNQKYLRPIKQPRFYVGKFHLSAYGSLGGIRINYKLEVLNKDYEVIPGFYAVGTDVNTLYGDTYIFALPGNTMGFAVNSGRMAGENAVEYIKSLAK